MRLTLFVLFLTLSFTFRPPAARAQVVQWDSSETLVRHFDTNKLADFRRDADFFYDREPPASASWLAKLTYWFAQLLKRLAKSFNPSGSFKLLAFIWGLVPFIIIGAIIVILLLYLKKTDLGNLFYGEGKKSIEFEHAEENIHEINYEQQIEEAINNGFYRKAIRLLYLKTLKMLADSGRINWKIHKTNYDYILEMRSANYGQDFRQITIAYERIWYGHFDIDQEIFLKLRKAFSLFEQKIATSR